VTLGRAIRCAGESRSAYLGTQGPLMDPRIARDGHGWMRGLRRGVRVTTVRCGAFDRRSARRRGRARIFAAFTAFAEGRARVDGERHLRADDGQDLRDRGRISRFESHKIAAAASIGRDRRAHRHRSHVDVPMRDGDVQGRSRRPLISLGRSSRRCGAVVICGCRRPRPQPLGAARREAAERGAGPVAVN